MMEERQLFSIDAWELVEDLPFQMSHKHLSRNPACGPGYGLSGPCKDPASPHCMKLY